MPNLLVETVKSEEAEQGMVSLCDQDRHAIADRF